MSLICEWSIGLCRDLGAVDRVLVVGEFGVVSMPDLIAGVFL